MDGRMVTSCVMPLSRAQLLHQVQTRRIRWKADYESGPGRVKGRFCAALRDAGEEQQVPATALSVDFTGVDRTDRRATR